jgi:hypothetical protein
MLRSISNRTSIRLTVSSAISEIAAAFLPRRAAMSARSKNCRVAWAQHSADVIGPSARDGSYRVSIISIGLQNAGEVSKMPKGMFASRDAQ